MKPIRRVQDILVVVTNLEDTLHMHLWCSDRLQR